MFGPKLVREDIRLLALEFGTWVTTCGVFWFEWALNSRLVIQDHMAPLAFVISFVMQTTEKPSSIGIATPDYAGMMQRAEHEQREDNSILRRVFAVFTFLLSVVAASMGVVAMYFVIADGGPGHLIAAGIFGFTFFSTAIILGLLARNSWRGKRVNVQSPNPYSLYG